MLLCMDDLQSILKRVLKKRGLHDHAQAALVVHKARLWLADQFPELRHALVVERFTDGILTISCGHSGGLQACREMLPELLEMLQRDCDGVVRDIRLERSGTRLGAAESLAEPSALP